MGAEVWRDASRSTSTHLRARRRPQRARPIEQASTLLFRWRARRGWYLRDRVRSRRAPIPAPTRSRSRQQQPCAGIPTETARSRPIAMAMYSSSDSEQRHRASQDERVASVACLHQRRDAVEQVLILIGLDDVVVGTELDGALTYALSRRARSARSAAACGIAPGCGSSPSARSHPCAASRYPAAPPRAVRARSISSASMPSRAVCTLQP